MAGDWIKIYRGLMDSAVWSDEWLVKLWLWCLLKANFRDSIWQGRDIKRGQFVTGRLRASEELDVSPGKWLRGMEKLVQAGCISLKSDNQCTIVTVCKYETYQDATGQGGTADSTANGTASSTADGTPSGTPNGTADGTRTKKDKNSQEEQDNTNTPLIPQGGADEPDWQLEPEQPSTKSQPKPAPYSPAFERFWIAYPNYRKTGKGAAWRSWQKAIRGTPAETIIAAAERYAASPKGQGEFAKAPTSWINARCWEDAPEAWGSPPEKKQRLPTDEERANWTPH